MKEKIYNYDNIDIKDIDDKVIRVKAIMLNDNEELLLGTSFGTYQFPGGHQEEGEELLDTLKREVLEETGIILNANYEPFFVIKYFLKDHPVVGHNRSIEIYYYLIKTNEVYNLDNINLDDEERKGNFKLEYVPLKKVKKLLSKHKKDNPINKLINKEMNMALKVMKKEG